jgi:prophage antirepressor-like protein
MTEALAALFEGKEIHAFEKDGDIWVPVADVAAAWGVDRTTPNHIILRNPEVFEGTVIGGDVTSHDGPCLSERGLYMLMGKISAARLKNPEAKAAVIRFQRWVPELIQKYRKKEITQVPAAPDIRTELLQAKEYADICGKAPEIFQAKVFQKHGLPEFADALQVPSSIHGETGWYIPTQLGEMCALTATQLNHWLNNKGFQYREGTVWRLQPMGELHGQEYWFEAPSGHREIRIRWRESILYASGLKREIPASQLMLPARA